MRKRRNQKMEVNNINQVSGNHYENLKIEPVQAIAHYKLNWFQGEAIKYLSRYPYKGGYDDLKKAFHVLSMASELKSYPQGNFIFKNSFEEEYTDQFKGINFFADIKSQEYHSEAIKKVIRGDYYSARQSILSLMYSEYPYLSREMY